MFSSAGLFRDKSCLFSKNRNKLSELFCNLSLIGSFCLEIVFKYVVRMCKTSQWDLVQWIASIVFVKKINDTLNTFLSVVMLAEQNRTSLHSLLPFNDIRGIQIYKIGLNDNNKYINNKMFPMYTKVPYLFFLFFYMAYAIFLTTGVTKAVVCVILSVHIKEPLLLIGKSSLCGGSGFPFSLSEWSLTICLTPYNHR